MGALLYRAIHPGTESHSSTSPSQQSTLVLSSPLLPSPSLVLPPPGTNQLFINALNAIAKQEFIEAVHYGWKIQGNIELAALDLNSLLYSGNTFNSAMDALSLAVTLEAIYAESLYTNDDNDVEDNYENKVEPTITATILLNHQHATAFIDSGASHSFISLAVAKKYLYSAFCEHHYTIISHINDIEITLGDRSITHITCCIAHILIDCGSHKLHHHFFIMLLQDKCYAV